MGTLFIGKGYDLEKEYYFMPYNRVYTRFTMMNKLKQTNLPAVFDDLPTDWILKNKEDLKPYVQTGHFGDRGKGDQTEIQYRGMRSFIGTINDEFRMDDDLALSLRLLIQRYTEFHRRRKNKIEFDRMFDSLSKGFMYEVFRAAFEGERIDDLLKEVERFESVSDWINYGIARINKLCEDKAISKFPEFNEKEHSDSFTNAFEIAQAFMEEWGRIESSKKEYIDKGTGETVQKVTYRSQIEGAFKVEANHNSRRYLIHFTPSAFQTIKGK